MNGYNFTLEGAREKIREVLGEPEPKRASGESRIPKREAPSLVMVELRYEGG
jgi:hypothetical protein